MNNPQGAILTFSRTGSSTLTKTIRKTSVKAISELFSLSEKKERVEGMNFLYNTRSMRKSLDFLFSKYSIIQHKFQNVRIEWNLELIKYLKESNIPVLLYYRENYANRIKSKIISNQTQQWLAFDQPLETYEIANVSKSAFVKMIENYLIELIFYKRKMKETGLSYKMLSYEQLFGEKVTFEDQMVIIYDLLQYLNIPIKNKENYEMSVKPLLHPTRKMNSKKSYQIIPNINELEAYINNFDFETHIGLQKE